jgi:hypothetical protein
MKFGKTLAVTAALVLAAAPAAIASAAPAPAKLSAAEMQGASAQDDDGGLPLIAIGAAGLALVVGGILLLADGDNNAAPASPD